MRMRKMAGNDFPKYEANYCPLTPMSFIQRAAAVYPDRVSLIYGERRFTWAQTLERCRRLASALHAHSISKGDTVAVIAPNVPAMYEVHFGVPMAGAVLNTINVRLDARTMSTILGHADAKLVLADTEFLPVVNDALLILSTTHQLVAAPLLVHIEDETCDKVDEIRSHGFGKILEYEAFLGGGDSNFSILWPKDEWEAISINYTSGTTSSPKGVVYHHRGAYINALVAALDWGMPAGAVYLWTVPMFHCNGWCFTWSLAAQAGTNVCLRTVKPSNIFDAIVKHRVTHMAGAPIVLNLIVNAEVHQTRPLPHKLEIWTGGAPPPPAIIAKLEYLGFSLGHGYGLTETYGPSVSCVWKEEWNSLSSDRRAQLKARQGVGHLGISGADVFNTNTMTPVPRDGVTMGEVLIKGHTIMKGYLKDQQATEDAFRGGWFHTGDQAVMHPDGYIEVKDRLKDIIISGGENISSIEVESILFQHPQILEAAVVARPDGYWGETPCAFVTLRSSAVGGKDSGVVSEKSIIEFCRDRLPHYMSPRSVIFGNLPKTATGKVQKNVLRDQAKMLGSISAIKMSKL